MFTPHRTRVPSRAPWLAGCASTRSAAADTRRSGRHAIRAGGLRARLQAATAALAAALALMAAPAGTATATAATAATATTAATSAATSAGAATSATSPVVAGGVVCQPVAVPVTAGLIGPATIHATLCTPPDPNGDLQVLISGATYNSWFWIGEGVTAYSYVAAANQAGATTLAIDPLGTGQSTRPRLSALLTGAEQVSAIHQVIQAARAGRVDGITHQRVLLVGHSMGSMAAILLAASHPGDATGVVLTGFTHLPSTTTLADAFLGPLRPADLEGFGLALDPGWLTTVPGTREALFGNPADEDPAVAAGDEAHRDLLSTVEISDTLTPSLAPTATLAIHVPVLMVDGSADTLFCGPLTAGCATATDLYAHEHADFNPDFAALVVPGAGHDVALARNAATAADAIQQWAAALRAGRVLTGPLGG